MIVLISVFHACMDWTVSYERLPSISVFSYVLADFSFFQITSDYLIPCFFGCPMGRLPLNFKVTRPSTLFYLSLKYSLLDDQNIAIIYPVNVPSCASILV